MLPQLCGARVQVELGVGPLGAGDGNGAPAGAEGRGFLGLAAARPQSAARFLRRADFLLSERAFRRSARRRFKGRTLFERARASRARRVVRVASRRR